MSSFIFPGKLIIKDKAKALLEAKEKKGNLKLECNRIKLENKGTGVAMI